MLYSLELSPVTYLAFCVLGVVVFFYFQQRREYQRHVNAQSEPSDRLTISDTKIVGASSPKLPTFSAQEVEQRKPAKEIDQTTLNPRNLQHFPEFGNRKEVSGIYGSKSQALGTTEKIFDGFRKSVPYDPVTRPTESSSVFAHLGRSETVPEGPQDSLGFHKRVSYSQKPSNEINIHESQYRHPPNLNQVKDEQFLLEKDDAKIIDQTSINKYGVDLDNEYKVFSQEFKQKEGKTFHEEAKRFDSPQRSGWGISALDRVGHSPESPFKIFESPFFERDSKKILKSNERDQKPSKKHTGSLVKKESLSRVQEPLNQENRGREDNLPIQSKQSKLSAKLERKSKPNQIFMDVNSDDEMAIEKERELKNRFKRSGISSQSIDNIEKEATTEKYFKDNNFGGKARFSEEKSLVQNIGSLSPRSEAKGPSKRKSTVDIAYLSEMGGNLSMRRYIEKKTAQDNLIKSNKVSTAGSYQKNDFSNESRTKSSSLLKEEKPKDEHKPFTSLIQPTGFTNPKKSTNGGSFLFTKESKILNNDVSYPPKPIILSKEDDKMIEEQKPKVEIKSDDIEQVSQNDEKKIEKPSIFQNTIVNKIEPPKISNILGGSSIFSQKQPEPNTASSLFSNKTEESKNKDQGQLQEKSQLSKKEEVVEKETLPKESSIQQNPSGFDLFKTVRAGAAFPKPEELNDKNKEIEKSTLNVLQKEDKKEEKKLQANDSSQEKKVSLFGNITNGEKKIEENSFKNQEPDSKVETKTLFGASGPGGSILPSLTKNQGASSSNQEISQTDDLNKKAETTGTSLFGGLTKPNVSSLPSQSSLFGAPSIKREDSKDNAQSPKSNFFNKPKPEEKNALNPSGGIFGSAFSQQKSSNQEVGSPNNEKVGSPPTSSTLFGNSSAFSKTSFAKNDGSQKTDTPMFGSLKPVEGDSSKSTGGLFNNLGKSESGLFNGSTSIGGSNNGSLWSQNLSAKSDLFKK